MVSSDETHGLGYERVDDDPNVGVLVDTMDATSRWAATLHLRAWEREQLALRPGERLLDVGCGPGDAALALAEDLGLTGELVGVDASAAMIDAARRRAAATEGCVRRFAVGDAHALDDPDGSFDAARSERTLQWLADPERAVAELVRVVRPGGRVALIDSDWSTFGLDIGDAAVAEMVRAAMQVERARPWNVGSRLGRLVRAAGLVDVTETSATQRWDRWDPDRSRAPEGCFSMESLAEDLVDAGQLAAEDAAGFVSTVHAAARADRFSMSLTMFAVVGHAAIPQNEVSLGSLATTSSTVV